MSNSLIALLTKALEEHQLLAEEQTIKKFVSFLELLAQWNRVFNLTNIHDPRDSVYLHIIDSLLVIPYLQGDRYLDVGSGGGLPGIPLAIMLPATQWTLLDKNSKKTRFLTQIVAQLSLANVNIIHDHCEYFQPASGFDSILSRAFGTLRKMIDATEHLLHQQGRWIAMKGKYPADELLALSDDVIYQVSQLDMKGMDIKRHVVCISRE